MTETTTSKVQAAPLSPRPSSLAATVDSIEPGVSSMTIPRDENGLYPTYTDLGGYPVFYLCDDGEDICPACANEHGHIKNPENGYRVVEFAVNWEDEHLHCDHCSARIESAYGEDKDDEDDDEDE
jgi:hypothetical protein